MKENQTPEIAQGAKSEKKGKKTTDSINLESVKINVKKGKKDLLSKEFTPNSKKNLYKGMEGLSAEDQKKKRSFIRRKRNSFINSILGKDRSEEDRAKSVKEFLKFYKENWKIQDFSLENFCQTKDKEEVKDIEDFFKYLQSIMEK